MLLADDGGLTFWTALAAIGAVVGIPGAVMTLVVLIVRIRRERAKDKAAYEAALIEQGQKMAKKEHEEQLFREQTTTLLTSTAQMKQELKEDIKGIRDDQAEINDRLLKHESDRADINATLLRQEQQITDDRHEMRVHVQRIGSQIEVLTKTVETFDGTLKKNGNGNH